MTGAPRAPVLRLWLFLIVASCLFGVFALPWLVPFGEAPIVSESQAVGFSNRAALVSLVVAALALAAMAYFRGGPAPCQWLMRRRDQVERLDRRTIILALVGTAAFAVAMAAFFGRYPIMDARYMVDRMWCAASGATIYRDFEFSYGPALLYPQVGLYQLVRGLGWGLHAAYYVWYVAMQVVGVLLLVIVLDRVAMPLRVKRSLFWGIGAFAAIQPTLGVNYALVRFLPPFVLLPLVIGAARGRRGVVAGPAVGIGAVALCLLISPETGIALFAALVIGLAWLGLRAAPRFFGQLAVLVIGAGAAIATVGGTGMIGGFLAGAMAFPVLPGPGALLFVAAVLVVAWGAGRVALRDDPFDGSAALAWLALTLAMSAAAFARADVAHIFWNGLGAWIIAPAVIATMDTGRLVRWSVRVFSVVFMAWLLIYTVVDLGPEVCSAGIRSGSVGESAAAVAGRWSGRGAGMLVSDLRAVRASLPTARQLAYLGRLRLVTVPLTTLNGDVVETLAHEGVEPAGYNAQIAVSADQVLRIVERSTEANRVLVAFATWERYRSLPDRGKAVMAKKRTSAALKSFLLFGLPFAPAVRHRTLDVGASFGPALARGWVEEARVGEYVVLKRALVNFPAVVPLRSGGRHEAAPLVERPTRARTLAHPRRLVEPQ